MWWVPIVAAIAGSAASAGLNKLMAPDPTKPQEQAGKLGSIQQAQQGQQIIDPMAEDILQQYLAGAAQRKAVV
jgi:hypothetical protein